MNGKIEKRDDGYQQHINSAGKYEDLLENLRTRLNVLNTSIFLLEDNLADKSDKTDKYLKRINSELKRIRKMVINFPDEEQPG